MSFAFAAPVVTRHFSPPPRARNAVECPKCGAQHRLPRPAASEQVPEPPVTSTPSWPASPAAPVRFGLCALERIAYPLIPPPLVVGSPPW